MEAKPPSVPVIEVKNADEPVICVAFKKEEDVLIPVTADACIEVKNAEEPVVCVEFKKEDET